VLSEHCLEYVVLFVAAQKAGFILVLLNYRLSASELRYLLDDAQPGLLITEEQFADKVGEVVVSSRWSVEGLRDFCDPARVVAEDADFPLVPVAGDDPIFILYTSGTTGFPKGALYTHRMLFWNSINTSISLIVNTESRTVNCMPPFHTGGWNVLLTPFLHHGAYTCLMKKFDAAAVLQSLQDEQATLFMGVPTMLRMIADLPAFTSADLSSLYYIIVGGEPMPIPLIELWHDKGVPIRQEYGMTEVGPNLTSLHQDDAIRKQGSIGRPNFYVQTRIVGADGEELGPDQAGELLIYGPMVTPGYWRNLDASAKSIREGWFHTGDRVRCDKEGYLYVVDRIKNMFISGGENIYPAEVERILLQHEAIAEVIVIGVPDNKWGEVGQAHVVLKPDTQTSEAELLDYAFAHLAKFKVPKSVIFRDALPKNDTGKVDRRALNMRLSEG